MFHGFLGLFFYPLSFFSLSLVSMMAAATLHLNLKTNLRALTAKSQRRRNISYSSSSSFPKYKWIFVIFFFLYTLPSCFSSLFSHILLQRSKSPITAWQPPLASPFSFFFVFLFFQFLCSYNSCVLCTHLLVYFWWPLSGHKEEGMGGGVRSRNDKLA